MKLKNICGFCGFEYLGISVFFSLFHREICRMNVQWCFIEMWRISFQNVHRAEWDSNLEQQETMFLIIDYVAVVLPIRTSMTIHVYITIWCYYFDLVFLVFRRHLDRLNFPLTISTYCIDTPNKCISNSLWVYDQMLLSWVYIYLVIVKFLRCHKNFQTIATAQQDLWRNSELCLHLQKTICMLCKFFWLDRMSLLAWNAERILRTDVYKCLFSHLDFSHLGIWISSISRMQLNLILIIALNLQLLFL